MTGPVNARGRLPWDYDAPDWGRFDYRAWRESYDVCSAHWICRGLFHQLLDLQWYYGFVPNNEHAVASLLGIDRACDGDLGRAFEGEFTQVWNVAVSFFEPHPADPEKLINMRQAYERWRAIDAVEQKATAGKKGGLARARKRQQRQAVTSDAISDARAPSKQRSTELELEDVPTEPTVPPELGVTHAGAREPADQVLATVNAARQLAGLTPLTGDKRGLGYIRARIREHGQQAVLAVAEYAPQDPWIQTEVGRLTLAPIFSPKSFPQLLDRMQNGNGLSAADRRLIARRQALEAIDFDT